MFRENGNPVVLTHVRAGVLTCADRAVVLPDALPAEKLALVPALDAQPIDIVTPKKHWELSPMPC